MVLSSKFPSDLVADSTKGIFDEVISVEKENPTKSLTPPPPQQGPHPSSVDAADAVAGELPIVDCYCWPKKISREPPPGVLSPCLAAAAPCRRHSATPPHVRPRLPPNNETLIPNFPSSESAPRRTAVHHRRSSPPPDSD
ncbi:hypothetical protein PIB30_032496 [Stylosanthes scabra]|uniref:Uncharacterized protein n=1 Tax=Stylosanthes scabra TaxID=79078 RepID=A0ABU6VCY9_9FABA|nr:hypothetical protein [Stylosanthes scabra]